MHICEPLQGENCYGYNQFMLDPEKLQIKRKKMGLNQRQAAVAAGISAARWNDIEKGGRTNLRIATLDKIAGVLKCKPKDLLK